VEAEAVGQEGTAVPTEAKVEPPAGVALEAEAVVVAVLVGVMGEQGHMVTVVVARVEASVVRAGAEATARVAEARVAVALQVGVGGKAAGVWAVLAGALGVQAVVMAEGARAQVERAMAAGVVEAQEAAVKVAVARVVVSKAKAKSEGEEQAEAAPGWVAAAVGTRVEAGLAAVERAVHSVEVGMAGVHTVAVTAEVRVVEEAMAVATMVEAETAAGVEVVVVVVTAEVMAAPVAHCCKKETRRRVYNGQTHARTASTRPAHCHLQAPMSCRSSRTRRVLRPGRDECRPA